MWSPYKEERKTTKNKIKPNPKAGAPKLQKKKAEPKRKVVRPKGNVHNPMKGKKDTSKWKYGE